VELVSKSRIKEKTVNIVRADKQKESLRERIVAAVKLAIRKLVNPSGRELLAVQMVEQEYRSAHRMGRRESQKSKALHRRRIKARMERRSRQINRRVARGY
jgi:hypothetical protein